jgi:polysaccharide biosynthesis/export protein
VKKFSASLVLATILLSACAAPRKFVAGPHLSLVPQTELPVPEGVTLGEAERPYHIGPMDRLAVSVFGVPDLTQQVQVDSSGHIALPLVGSLQASGLTPAELSGKIAEALRRQYVRNPRVAVNVTEAVSQTITVEGQVGQPGLLPVVGRMTLLRAIAAAKGTSEFARLEQVVVFRDVGEQRYAALYDLGAIRRGLYPDPEIFADDIVVVGDSPQRRLFRDILQASPLITTPIVALLQQR